MREKWMPKLTKSQVRVFINPARLRNLAKTAASLLRVSPRRETAQNRAPLRRRDHQSLPRDHDIAHAGVEKREPSSAARRMLLRSTALPRLSLVDLIEALRRAGIQSPSFQDSVPDTLPALAVLH